MFSHPLRRLRYVGILEGISFLILLGIAMPLKYFADSPGAVRVVGMLHGVLFIAFIALVIDVTIRRGWWSPKFWLSAMVASVLPFGTFVLDHWLKKVELAEAAK